MKTFGFLMISTFLVLFATLLPYSSASTTRRFHFNVSKFYEDYISSYLLLDSIFITWS